MPRLFPTSQRGRAKRPPASIVFGVASAETPRPEATSANANRNACFANEPGAVANGNIILGNGSDAVELLSESMVKGNGPIRQRDDVMQPQPHDEMTHRDKV